MIDYLSGFFDADGSITMSKSTKSAKYRTIKIDFSNNEITILKEIQLFLTENDISSYISTKPAKKETHSTAYTLSVNSNQMCVKLCRLLRSKHPKKLHRINTVLKYHDLVTNKGGHYTGKEHTRRIAYERLFFSLSFH